MSATPSAGSCFSCRDLSVDFHDGKRATRRILDSLDFDIEDGEFVSVLGGSGVGKSTLLRVLGGLQAVTPDSVVLHRGQSVAGPPDRVVTVFQDYAASLLPWRTVARNVTLGIESAPKQERERRGAEALDMVGLADRRRAYPRQLSGGMQQRLQIARALVMQPSALLMDEPFGALDAMTKANLQDALLEIHRRTEATTVFVTHDIDEAVYLSDRIFVLAGSPAHIALELTVDLPRPRHQVTTKEHPRYLQLRHRAYEAIGVRTARVAS